MKKETTKTELYMYIFVPSLLQAKSFQFSASHYSIHILWESYELAPCCIGPTN